MNKSINPLGRGRALSGSACKSQGKLGFSSVAAGLGSGPSPERFGIPGTALGEKELSGWGNHPGISPGTVRVPRSPPGSTDPKQAGQTRAGRVCPHKADFWNGSGLFSIPPGIRALFQSFPAAQSAAKFPPALPNHHLPFAFFPPISTTFQPFSR